MPDQSIQIRLTGDQKTVDQLRRAKTLAAGALAAMIDAAAEVIQDIANPLAPGPHITRATYSPIGGKSIRAEVGPDADHWYYRFRETGAQPHDISGSPVLAFETSAGLVVAPQVSQAGGMTPDPFLRPAVDTGQARAEKAAAAVMRQELDRL